VKGGKRQKQSEGPGLIILGMKSLEKDFPQLWILAHGEKGRFKFGMEQPGIDSQVKIDPPPMIEPGKEVSPFPRRAQLLVAPNGPQVGQELVRACGPLRRSLIRRPPIGNSLRAPYRELGRMDWWSGGRKGFRGLSGNVGPTRVYSDVLLIPWGKKGQGKGELLGITPFDRYQFTVKLKHPGFYPNP